MNETELQLLKAIESNPMASQQELADQLGMTRESVAGYVSRLTKRGAILGKGYILPQNQAIVVLGGANVDMAGQSHRDYQPGDSNPGTVQQSAGGVGRNIAENLARLGEDTSLISLVGQDSRGRFLIDQAIGAGINVQDVSQLSGLATSTYLALHNERGELLGSIADMAIMDAFTPDFLTDKMSRLLSAQRIVVDANLPANTLAWLAEQAITGSMIADAVSATKAVRLKPLLRKLNVLKVNRAEASAILDQSISDQHSHQDVIDALHDQGVKTVLLSLSSEGVIVSDGTTSLHQPVLPSEPISDAGAGDALLAGFVHAQSSQKTLNQQIEFAVACAAVTLEAESAVHTSLSDAFVQKRLKT